jgi:hypothetical protein
LSAPPSMKNTIDGEEYIEANTFEMLFKGNTTYTRSVGEAVYLTTGEGLPAKIALIDTIYEDVNASVEDRGLWIVVKLFKRTAQLPTPLPAGVPQELAPREIFLDDTEAFYFKIKDNAEPEQAPTVALLYDGIEDVDFVDAPHHFHYRATYGAGKFTVLKRTSAAEEAAEEEGVPMEAEVADVATEAAEAADGLDPGAAAATKKPRKRCSEASCPADRAADCSGG